MTIKVLVLKSGEDVIADVREMVSSDEKVIGYFLTKPCVVKLTNTTDLTKEETDSKTEKKSEFSVTMYPWAPLAREKSIPISTDWVVTMVTPTEKIYEMYKEDILKNGQEDGETDSAGESADSGIAD